MTNNFTMPKSPYTEQQTADMKRLKDEILPWMMQQIADAEKAGLDVTTIRQNMELAKEQLAKLVAVYGDKYK
jgi:hypothetical protein